MEKMHNLFDLTASEKKHFIAMLWKFLASRYINFGNSRKSIKIKDIEKGLLSADGILLLGSNDMESANTAAKLYFSIKAANPDIVIVSSGGGGGEYGHATVPFPVFLKKEAVVYYERLIQLGVNPEDIIIEDQSKNTGENIKRSYALIKEKGMDLNRIIIVQSPAAQKRSNLSLEYQWGSKKEYGNISDNRWNYYISYPPKFPEIKAETLDFHLVYALRELTTIIRYMHGPERYIAEEIIPENILSILQTIHNKSLLLNTDSLHYIIYELFEYYRLLFNELEKPYKISTDV